MFIYEYTHNYRILIKNTDKILISTLLGHFKAEGNLLRLEPTSLSTWLMLAESELSQVWYTVTARVEDGSTQLPFKSDLNRFKYPQ